MVMKNTVQLMFSIISRETGKKYKSFIQATCRNTFILAVRSPCPKNLQQLEHMDMKTGLEPSIYSKSTPMTHEWVEINKIVASDSAPDSYFSRSISLFEENLFVGHLTETGEPGYAYIYNKIHEGL